MGRKTYQSIPEKYRPLPNRKNIIVTNNLNARDKYNIDSDVNIAFSFEESLSQAYKYIYDNILIDDDNNIKMGQIYVIGGYSLFLDSINHKECDKIYYTQIYKKIDCDVYMPEIPDDKFKVISSSEMQEENGYKFKYFVYQKN